jgi:hypothetical protein
MRRIKIEKWKSKNPSGSEADEDLLVVLNVLIGNKRPEEVPRGLDKFRLFNRVTKAFEKADKTGVLELEEFDYSFLKETIEKDIPCVWGMNPSISKAVEEFLNAKQE